MGVGERIRFIRNLRRRTQKWLGMAVGFPEKGADVRMAQYESGTRTPKADLTNALAEALDVSPDALTVPNIDSYNGIMHTLFALEDLYGFQIDFVNGEICLHLDKRSHTMNEHFRVWYRQFSKLRSGAISKEEYDQWRYNYPHLPAEPHFHNN